MPVGGPREARAGKAEPEEGAVDEAATGLALVLVLADESEQTVDELLTTLFLETRAVQY